MGACCRKTIRRKNHQLPGADELVYSTTLKIAIQMKDTPHYVPESVEYLVHLEPPQLAQGQHLFTNNRSYSVSSCVLPGQDLFHKTTTVCQDSTLVCANDQLLLVGVYDGHGKYGRDVSHHARSLMKTKFRSGFEPTCAFFEDAMLDCDGQVQSEPGVDVSYSGTSAIHACIMQNRLYVSNVGSAFGILATSSAGESQIALPDFPKSHGFEKTRGLPRTSLRTLALTQRHVPSELLEKKRIEDAGGKVRRLYQNDIPVSGPRVWCKDLTQPGLNVSRAIGHSSARRIGVTPNPTVSEYEIDPAKDQFIVIASSRLWQVMNPVQVTQFVEAYRYDCTIRQQPAGQFVKPSNACIAYLLCEEARYRWLSLSGRHSKGLKDIACVVVEFCKFPLFANRNDHTVKIQRTRPQPRRGCTADMQFVQNSTNSLTKDSLDHD